MIIDTSVIVAILFGEPDGPRYTQMILDADRCALSVANYVELSMVVEGQAGLEGGRQMDLFLRRAGIVIEPITVEQGHMARQGFHEFGKGRHPAGLNFGDCFAYALAKWKKQPLLFQGEDFSRTDVLVAAK